jgi:CubicO group peptidase (beta-lactamase class C family)
VARRALRILFLLILLSLVLCCKTDTPTSENVLGFQEHLDDIIPDLLDRYSVPGLGVALIRNGQVQWIRHWGYADLDRQTPMTSQTRFRVESISKPITAWGILALKDQGLINLWDPVAVHLSHWPSNSKDAITDSVTIDQLLSQRSGLALGTIGEEYAPGEAMPDLPTYLNRESKWFQAPGTGFSYSNVGFNWLQALIESKTGQSFDGYLQAQLFDPLRMTEATFSIKQSPDPLLATGYDLDGRAVPQYYYPAQASGGLRATVADIATFAAAVEKQDLELFRAANQELLLEPLSTELGVYGWVADAYGRGHFLETLSTGTLAAWHGGQGHGWMSHLHMIPETGDAIVILTNSQRSWPLISTILSDWSDDLGYGRVKMSRIATGYWVFEIITVLLAVLTLSLLTLIMRAWYRKQLLWDPAGVIHSTGRFTIVMIALTVLGLLLWSALQPYLMISSVFPGISTVAGWILAGLTIVLLLRSLFHGQPDPT